MQNELSILVLFSCHQRCPLKTVSDVTKGNGGGNLSPIVPK